MPVFHGSLTNEDFIKANEIAKDRNMELKDWVVAVVMAEIQRVKQSEAKSA